MSTSVGTPTFVHTRMAVVHSYNSTNDEDRHYAVSSNLLLSLSS